MSKSTSQYRSVNYFFTDPISGRRTVERKITMEFEFIRENPDKDWDWNKLLKEQSSHLKAANKGKSYTYRISKLLRGDECIGKFAYVIVFCHDDQEEDLDVIKEYLGDFFTEKVEFVVIGEALFGKDNNIPVYTLEMKSKELETNLIECHEEIGRPDNGIFPDKICWHVSKRNLSVDLNVGDTIIGHQFDIKQLGSHDPLYTKSL